MKIKILCFNRVESEFMQVVEHYFYKIKKFCTIELIELIETTNKDLKANMIKNESLLEKKLADHQDYEVFLLEISGKQCQSNQFAELILNNRDFKGGKILFLIGPSDGFSAPFVKKYQNHLSFGKATFPYSLIRVILLEQLYRAFKIIRNEPYHK